MLGRFGRLSGRCGAYDDIRDRFPLVAKSKEGSVGDMAGLEKGVYSREWRSQSLVVRESDEQKQSESATDQFVAERSELIIGDWR
jgi:hypothetical protein